MISHKEKKVFRACRILTCRQVAQSLFFCINYSDACLQHYHESFPSKQKAIYISWMHGSICKAMDNTNEQPPVRLLGGVLNLFTRTNAHLQHFKKHFFLKHCKKNLQAQIFFWQHFCQRNRVRWRHLKQKFQLTLKTNWHLSLLFGAWQTWSFVTFTLTAAICEDLSVIVYTGH